MTRWRRLLAADNLLRLAAAVALLLSVYSGIQYQRLVTCITAYNEAANRATAARTAAAEQDRRAQDELFRAVAANPRGAVTAIRAYNAQRAQADAQRAAAPLPAPPSQRCG